MKRIISFVLCVSLVLGVVLGSPKTTKVSYAKKGTYWLYSTSASFTADGKKVKIKSGKWAKGSSKNKLYEKKETKKYKTLKMKNTCMVRFEGGDGGVDMYFYTLADDSNKDSYASSFKTMTNEKGYGKYLKIKNNKVVKIVLVP